MDACDPPLSPLLVSLSELLKLLLATQEEELKTISVATHIQSPPEVIWQILTDFEAYANWNPFITQISGNLVVGHRLRIRIVPPGAGGMTFRPTVTAQEPGRRVEWLGALGFRGLFDGRHAFVLEPRADGGTILTQTEDFSGVIVPMAGEMIARTEKGFVEMNNALRDRAESFAAAAGLPPAEY
jgi:hypothetical protein